MATTISSPRFYLKNFQFSSSTLNHPTSLSTHINIHIYIYISALFLCNGGKSIPNSTLNKEQCQHPNKENNRRNLPEEIPTRTHPTTTRYLHRIHRQKQAKPLDLRRNLQIHDQSTDNPTKDLIISNNILLLLQPYKYI